MPVACPTGSVPSQKFEPNAMNFWWRSQIGAARQTKTGNLTAPGRCILWYARRDSNPQPSEPESDALSIEPLAHINFNCKADYSRFSKFCKEVTEFLFAACGAAGLNYFAQEFCLTFDIKATIMKKADEALKVSWI